MASVPIINIMDVFSHVFSILDKIKSQNHIVVIIFRAMLLTEGSYYYHNIPYVVRTSPRMGNMRTEHLNYPLYSSEATECSNCELSIYGVGEDD